MANESKWDERRLLAAIGWNDWHERQETEQGGDGTLRLGRIAGQARGQYRVWSVDDGDLRDSAARVTGRLLREAEADAAGWPAVGDWVRCRPAAGDWLTIEAVLPRRSLLARRDAGNAVGEGAQQAVAANVDVVFVCEALDRPLRPRRIERLLAAVWGSGARPVVLLTKADTLPPQRRREAQAVAAAAASAAPVHAVSVQVGADAQSALDALGPHLQPGATAVLVGPSGAGKSTLANALLGTATQAVGAVRAGDAKGRHTTTARELLRLPGGALLIDSPGTREFGLLEGASDVGAVHSEIVALAQQCRFRDCRHEGEPGCAVAAAVEGGRLDAGRLEGFRKLARESAYFERRDDPRRARERDRAQGRLYRRILRDTQRREMDE